MRTGAVGKNGIAPALANRARGRQANCSSVVLGKQLARGAFHQWHVVRYLADDFQRTGSGAADHDQCEFRAVLFEIGEGKRFQGAKLLREGRANGFLVRDRFALLFLTRIAFGIDDPFETCLLYTSPSPRDRG